MSDTWKQWEGHRVNGKFPLQRYLGSSDHSAVFLTQYGEGQKQEATIKLLRVDPSQAEPQLSRWTQAEKLSDPGLIRIFEMGRSKLDDTALLYIVMEHADEDLAQILPQRALTPEEAQEMLSPVLNTLAYIHGQGFVHGSIKPSNIMAVADRVKLSSDSLRPGQETSEYRISSYAPPEAALGPISPAADVWSLGMTLVQTLTQRLPLPDPARPGTVVLPEGMPEPFADIARHCLQADPQQRWTIADIAARLKSAPVLSRTEPSVPAARSEKQSSAKWLYGMAVAVAGLIALVWMSGSKARTPNLPDQPAQVSPQPAQPSASAQPSPTKPSAAIPEKTQSAQETQEPGSSAAQAVASAPPVAAPQPEAEPALNTSTTTGGVTPGVAHTVLPVVSRRARNTIQGRVKLSVRVRVDTSGNVVSAVLDSPGPSKYFARLALEAAQDWKFVPAQAHGQPVGSQWILRFVFSRTNTEVMPRQTSP
jgi:TonB family protein